MVQDTKNYALMPLGEILLDLGYITRDQWEHALAVARREGREFTEVLREVGAASQDQLTHALALQNNLRFWDWPRIARIVEKHQLHRVPAPASAPAVDHLTWARENGPALIAVAEISDAAVRAQLKSAYAYSRVELVAVSAPTLQQARAADSLPEEQTQEFRGRVSTGTAELTHPPDALAADSAESTLPPDAGDAEHAAALVDGYRIDRRLAAGAAGEVFLAIRERDQSPVALKRLHPELAANQRAVSQILAESRLLETFSHPNIVKVYGSGLWDGLPYFAMEILPGDSLEDRLRAGRPLPIATVMRLWCQIADALAYAHRMGVLHRDIKPANVLLTEAGDAKVADFGIAHPTDSAIEQTSTAAGTLLYMAPEQLRGQPLGPAADIYALGMLAFEMLTGELPDGRLDLQAMVRRRQQRDPTFDDIRRPLNTALQRRGQMDEVGASLTDFARILHRCLRKNPRDRVRNAERLAKRLRQIMTLRDWPVPPEASLPPQRPHAWSTPGEGTADMDTVLAARTPTRLGGPPSGAAAGARTAHMDARDVRPSEDDGPRIPPDYDVIQKLGRGSMGEVFLAKDTETRRTVALKLIAPEMAANRRFRDRFQREAEVLGRLNHPSIVHIFGVQFEGPTPHIAMEYIQGRDLDTILKERDRLTVWESVPIICAVADALEHVHKAGIIHRDLKPSNLMLTAEGQVKILDFGVAKDTEGANLTNTGAVIGTPHYMSPEQASGQPATPLSDMYALGMIWYQLLVGRVPFRGSIPEVLHMHVAIQPPRVSESVPVPEDIDRLISRMLRKSPSERPATFREVIRTAQDAIRPPSAFARFWHSFFAPLVTVSAGAASLAVGYRAAKPDWTLGIPPDVWKLALLWAGGAAIAVGAFQLAWRFIRKPTSSAR